MSSLRYTVGLDAPGRHVADIALDFAVATDSVELAMPAWCPGSYLIRDYARFVRDLSATDETGAPRKIAKLDKTTWRVDAAGAAALTVRYGIYGHDLTVRTNHIDDTHAFLHGPATFLYPTHLRSESVAVVIKSTWQVTTAMTRDGDRYLARSIDELYDHPIHVGAMRTFSVAAKVPVELAIWGEKAPGGQFDEARLAQDLAAIVDDHVARFGEAPFAKYTFMLMLAHESYGGLEHRASSVNLFHPHFAATRKAYEGLLELLSHELFHAWNGKRIAPKPLLDFDYTREAYTPCLWVMEGITSHYDRFALKTSNRITAKSFLDKVLDDWARLRATPGRARQSLEQSSFDAWIKLYKPDESNLNTTVSYYLKGGLAMVALDLQIRRRTEGAKSLDDVLRLLWTRHGVTNEPHPDELQPLFEDATGISLGDVFARQIRGVDDPELAEELAGVGLELRGSPDPATVTDGLHAVWLGVTSSNIKVNGVFDHSPAQIAGLSPGDEIIAIDGFRTTSDADLRNLIATRPPGETVRLAVFRRHRLLEIAAVLGVAPPTRWEIAGIAAPATATARFQAWLGEAHPGVQSVATVTTTARWV
jgi:predicted metalloprotease with PDZ domain